MDGGGEKYTTINLYGHMFYSWYRNKRHLPSNMVFCFQIILALLCVVPVRHFSFSLLLIVCVCVCLWNGVFILKRIQWTRNKLKYRSIANQWRNVMEKLDKHHSKHKIDFQQLCQVFCLFDKIPNIFVLC